MEILILGTGCANCQKLEQVTRQAVASLGIMATVSKVTDIVKIMSFGVMSTPGLVINGQAVLSGRVPTVDEVTSLLVRAQGE